MPKEALTSFTECDAYRYFSGQALLMTSQSRSGTEYLSQTDNIMLLTDTILLGALVVLWHLRRPNLDVLE